MIDTPRITKTKDQQVAMIHVTVPRDRIREVMGPGLQELQAALAAQGITPTGPWFTHHLRMDPKVFDFEICLPVDATVKPAGRVVPGKIPAARVVRTVYHGSYEGLGPAWGEFDAWIKAQGHEIADDLLERYLKGPESGKDPAGWETELTRILR